MARKLRIDPIDGWHHVMNRGVDRQLIFVDDEDRIDFGRCVALACRRFGVELHAYCLMDNHFHLLLRCPDGHVSDVMHLACGLHARRMNARHGRVGHLFGDRFCSRLVTSVAYIANAVRYIHRNPLDIAGVNDPATYRWSSHQMYLGSRSPADFMRVDHVLNWFSSTAGFNTFVGNSAEVQRHEVVGLVDVDTDTIMQAIDLVIHERSLLSGRAVRTQRCAVALGVTSFAGQSAQTRMLDDLGFQSSSARRAARWRAKQHLDTQPATSHIVGPVLDLVAPTNTLAVAS